MSSPLRELTPDQYSRISLLLDESLELGPDERHAWLTDLQLRDAQAAELLRRLFASQPQGGAADFLNRPAPLAAALANALAGAIDVDKALVNRCFGPYRIHTLLGHRGMGSGCGACGFVERRGRASEHRGAGPVPGQLPRPCG